LNGLYGSKPAYGRIAEPDPSALVPHASPGPLARDIQDVILLQNIMSGPARGCPAVLRPKLELPLTAPAGKKFRIAVSLDQGWANLDPDVRTNALAAVERLRDTGASVEEIDLPLESSGGRLREAIEKGLFATAIGADLIDLEARSDQMTTYGRHFVKLACRMGPTDARDAAMEALRLYRIIDEQVFAAGYDALLTATVATTRIAADYDPTKHVPVVAGKHVDPYAGWFLTSVFSLLNWMPVMAVPAARAANGVPTGIQIAVRPYDAAAIALLYAQVASPTPFQAGVLH
jgi:Asp-tRNA(Asn)/Glu-tRNA(Gln) amidotransferase A subunit family amidase